LKMMIVLELLSLLEVKKHLLQVNNQIGSNIKLLYLQTVLICWCMLRKLLLSQVHVTVDIFGRSGYFKCRSKCFFNLSTLRLQTSTEACYFQFGHILQKIQIFTWS
jgi:hypothetical protein